MEHESAGRQFVQAYLRPIWAARWLIIPFVVLVTVAAYLHADSKERQYRASTKIFVRTSEVDALVTGGSSTDDDRNNANLAQLLHSRGVAAAAAAKLGGNFTAQGLLNGVEAVPAQGSDFITITAVEPSPKLAADVVNAFAAAFQANRGERLRAQARQALASSKAELAKLQGPGQGGPRRTLQNRIDRLETLETIPTGSTQQVDPALPPGLPFSPRPKRDAAFAFFVALLIALGAVFAKDFFDKRIKRLDDLGPAYGMPLVGTIPHFRQGQPARNGTIALPPPAREAFRTLRSNLQMEALDQPIRTLLVTSALPREGKSTVVRNLVLAYAELGLRVSVVDLDLRRPTVAEHFGVEIAPGVTDVLTGEASLEDAQRHVPIEMRALETAHRLGVGVREGNGSGSHSRSASITVLPSGPSPANPAAVLGARRLHDLILELRESNDIVVIDSAPLLPVSDTMSLLGEVDGVLVVARMLETDYTAAKRLQSVIGRVPRVRTVGVVANDLGEAEYDYAYGYGGSYYAEGTPAAEPETPAKS